MAIAGTIHHEMRRPADPDPVVQEIGPWFRRTWVRRTEAEIAQAGRDLASDAVRLLDPAVEIYPTPSPEGCASCHFAPPCQTLYRGEDPAPLLSAGFVARPLEGPVEGRLGGVSWSTGRGAAPPRFPDR
jgi:hypothetical protein